MDFIYRLDVMDFIYRLDVMDFIYRLDVMDFCIMDFYIMNFCIMDFYIMNFCIMDFSWWYFSLLLLKSKSYNNLNLRKKIDALKKKNSMHEFYLMDYQTIIKLHEI
jgi:hypothetical protein